MAENSDNADLQLLEEVAATAGEIALRYFKSDNQVWMKPGDSPVSQADLEVNAFLEKSLMAARPDYGWISEETEDNVQRQQCHRVFIIDPIDGTRGFIDGVDDWCISIAIVEAGRPVVALLECPALKERFCATAHGPSTLNGSNIQSPQPVNITSVAGTRQIKKLIKTQTIPVLQAAKYVPSLAYRIAKVATGDIDVAFARPGAHEWDVAAADLILSNAGGALVELDNEPLRYNQPQLKYDVLIARPDSLNEPAIDLAKSAGLLQ